MLFSWNPTYWLFAMPALLLALVAQAWVKSAFQRYLRVPTASRLTGAQAAQLLMKTAGISLRIEGTSGTLTDHYDPRSDTLRLSNAVATQPSVASVAIVAHEVGHAVQDSSGYVPARVRSGLVPVVNLTSWLGPVLFFLGLLIDSLDLAWLGVLCFSGAAVFALVTVPVELNASRRGLELLKSTGILQSQDELRAARTVLAAAALTYVAALAQTVSTLLYYGFMLSGRRRRRD